MANTASGRANQSRTKRQFIVVISTLIVAGGVAACGRSGDANSESSETQIVNSELNAVACPSTTQCVAVGTFLPLDNDAAEGDPDGDGHATHTLAEIRANNAWRVVPSPDKGKGGAVLTGVSCPAIGRCFAVGYDRLQTQSGDDTEPPPSYTLIEESDSGKWRIDKSPLAPSDSILESVSCPNATDCTTVGYSTIQDSDGEFVESPLIESLRQSTWSVLGGTTSSTSRELSSVSCPTTTFCVAVGHSATGNALAVEHPIIEQLSGQAIQPIDVASNNSTIGVLDGVVCTSPTQCIAAGSQNAGDGRDSALLIAYNGHSWTTNSAASDLSGNNSLATVSCATPVTCVAAGTSAPTLINRPSVLLANVGSGFFPINGDRSSDYARAIACPATSRCYVAGNNGTRATIATLSETRWVVEPAPLP